jgi:hypothetical protein
MQHSLKKQSIKKSFIGEFPYTNTTKQNENQGATYRKIFDGRYAT